MISFDIFGRKKIKALSERLEAAERATLSLTLDNQTLVAAARRVVTRHGPSNLKAANASREWKDLAELIERFTSNTK